MTKNRIDLFSLYVFYPISKPHGVTPKELFLSNVIPFTCIMYPYVTKKYKFPREQLVVMGDLRK